MTAALAELGNLEKARAMIRDCLDASVIREIRDKAKAVQVYQRERGLAVQAQQDSAELVMWAERRLGEILAATLAKGRPKKVTDGDTFSLSGLGVTAKQSSRWQKAAAVDQAVADSYVTMIRGTGSGATTGDLAELGKLTHNEGIAVVSQVMKGDAKDLRSALRAHYHAARQERFASVGETDPMGGLGAFGVVYADPPWRYDEGTAPPEDQIENHYETMTLDQICALPVAELGAPDSALVLWVPSPMAYDSASGPGVVVPVLEAWGYSYKAMMIWDKVSIKAGYWWRVRHELLILAVRGNVPTPKASDRESSVYREKSTTHSAKPPGVRTMIDRMFPGGRKIELFARGTPPDGWTFWGNQSESPGGRDDGTKEDDEAQREEEDDEGKPQGWPEEAG